MLRRLWEALGHGLDSTANQRAETAYAIVNHAGIVVGGPYQCSLPTPQVSRPAIQNRPTNVLAPELAYLVFKFDADVSDRFAEVVLGD